MNKYLIAILLTIFSFSVSLAYISAVLFDALAISGSFLPDGKPNAGGKVYFYDASAKTTAKDVYQDSIKTKVLAQPVILGNDGTAKVFTDYNTGYYLVIKDKNNKVIKTVNTASLYPTVTGGWESLSPVKPIVVSTNTYTASTTASKTVYESILEFREDGSLGDILTLGQRIKISAYPNLYYGIVTSVNTGATTTSVYIFSGTNSGLSVGTTINYTMFSGSKLPLGFPSDPATWSITLTDATDSGQIDPVNGTVYNFNNHKIYAPIGVWEYTGRANIHNTGDLALNLTVGLSTTSNSFSSNFHKEVYYKSGEYNDAVPYRDSFIINVTTPTTFYFVMQQSNLGGTYLGYSDNVSHPVSLIFNCAYF